MDIVSLVGRLLLSLAFVLGLMWVIARRVRSGSKGRGRQAKLVDVIARQQLSRNVSIAVVRVLQRTFIVGMTDQQVSLIAEVDADAVEAALEDHRRVSRTSRAAHAKQPRTATMTLVDGRLVRLDQLDKLDAQQDVPSPGTERRSNAAPASGARRGALSGSALSPQTWRQTFNSLRDITARTH